MPNFYRNSVFWGFEKIRLINRGQCHGPTTFLRVGKIKTHNKLSVECSPFKTKKQYSKLSRKTYLSSIINKTLPLFGEKAKKNKQLPSLPPKKNKVTLVIYFCEKTLPLFGKKAFKKILGRRKGLLCNPSLLPKIFFFFAGPTTFKMPERALHSSIVYTYTSFIYVMLQYYLLTTV